MIPDHLIDKAAMAAYDDHYWSDELYLLWGELGDRIQDEYRALARAALEAVAAHFWDEGEKVGYVHGQHDAHRFDPGPNYTETPNPYKRNEHA